VNLPSDEITVEGGNPSVSTTSNPSASSTIEPMPVEDCPLILIHEQSQLKRANEFMFSTEWKVCRMEQPGGNGCLYTRLPNTERIEDMIYCISIGTPSQDSTCCVPKENNDRVCTDEDGKTYTPDESWTCTDGCNTCKCTCSPERGCSIQSTKMACNELAPGPDAVDITPNKDAGIMKEIKVEGKGEGRPQTGDKVYVHYTGKLTNGSKFDSSRDRGEQISFYIGMSEVIKGWDIGVSTMKVGEVATFFIKSHYGYGSDGSPPKIPGDATLVFEIELFDFHGEEDVTKDKVMGERTKTADQNQD